jgi:hypothetical protein
MPISLVFPSMDTACYMVEDVLVSLLREKQSRTCVYPSSGRAGIVNERIKERKS